ncbi:pyruvate dehydrogenase (acetyl-transferring) E1 component subunit alpha [Candidatus Pacearchaeota archaeon]|nr:MAG: pyruvate dehydrogenase (acetyl-transferring) E1 component subunit alpha [Candidatus Pacearchaeota archaeon]
MKKRIASFDIYYLQVLDEKGKCDAKLAPKIPAKRLKEMYWLMLLTRAFDEKALNLQRQGRIGTYAQVKGQEACQIGSAILMQEQDLAFPSFREHGVFIARGTPLEKLFLYWGGDERGMDLGKVNVFPVSIPVGTHPLHAVGAAYAYKFQKKNAVTLAYFGDGATSEGDFHEAMNFAGVWQAPVVFICQNNQWAISTPASKQTAAKTLAQKAIAYGMRSVQVDGNDVLGVYSATKEAIENARKGKGPTLIECKTYRLGDHTTSDDARRYRSENEVKAWEKKDPITRFEKYLLSKGVLSQQLAQEMKEKAKQEVEKAVKNYESTPKASPEIIFENVYASLPANLQAQLEELKDETGSSAS